MSLILRNRKQVKEIKLSEENTNHQTPQFQNQYRYMIDRYGNRTKTWQPPLKSAYDRPLKKIKYDLWQDTRSRDGHVARTGNSEITFFEGRKTFVIHTFSLKTIADLSSAHRELSETYLEFF
jgi:hypothetical protein